MKYSFNKGWSFLETSVDTSYEEVSEKFGEFVSVPIPHDWLIYNSEDLYRDGTGWYLRKLFLNKKKGKYFLKFDAVYMDSAVYVNGTKVFEWKYGYSAFEVDITDHVKHGENLIVVSACYRSPNTRWYSGAGIFRNVWIRNTDETYIANDGIYVSTHDDNGKRILKVKTEVLGRYADNAKVSCTLYDALGKETDIAKISEDEFEILYPHKWDIDDTYLYTLKVTVNAEGEKGIDTDTDEVRFGIRDIAFDPDKGFLLNGRKIKLNGVCEHHDLGSLGAAFNKCAMKRKFKYLQSMGVNALRTSHNMPAPEVLDLADEMGILVLSEAFDMWYRPKTEFDYHRFFGEWHERDIESWVKQDRNHPSVIMWSIGNEIYDVHADAEAPDITKHLMDTVKKYDPDGNGMPTFASNFMAWEGGQKCADVIKLAGYNYAENLYKDHHAKHPDWIIYGSETASLVQSREVYKFPLSEIKLSDVDEQCSGLGNCNTSWGAKSVEACICQDRDMDFSAGQFLWTGFDYIGEPTPYHTKNSYFGLIDTAGFPKDFYYIFRSCWTDPKKSPMVHVFPYWDFNPGQMIDVRVCSNEDTVELFLNGESLGKQNLTHKPGSGDHILADYRVPYTEGTLEAVAYDENGVETARDRVSSFGDTSGFKIEYDRGELEAGSKDLIFVSISALDINGEPVRNASDRVTVSVTGAGRLVGLDNGDSTDFDSYKAVSRRLFNGKLLAIIAAGSEPGNIKFALSSEGKVRNEITFKCVPSTGEVLPAGVLHGSPFDKGAEEIFEENCVRKTNLGSESDIPVRKVEILCADRSLNADNRSAFAEVKIYPENATDSDIIYEAVSDKGVPVNIAALEPKDTGVLITALGDGDFRLRAMSKSGSDKIRVISELEFNITGIGKAFADPYEFIYGSSYSYSEGEIGTGNEMGFATSRTDKSLIGFENIDFGNIGSDEITIPIFALDSDEHPFKVYDGIPSKGGKLIGEFVYHKPSIWNVYQEDTWTFDEKLTGVHDLCFEFGDKVHVKGFSFKKYDKAFTKLDASGADDIYGDDFKIVGKAVTGIGNNVSLVFKEMDFGEEGTTKICIKGRAPKSDNTIHVRFADASGEIKNIIEFKKSEEVCERDFEFDKIKGMKDVSLVFMPGSYFDLESIEFKK